MVKGLADSSTGQEFQHCVRVEKCINVRGFTTQHHRITGRSGKNGTKASSGVSTAWWMHGQGISRFKHRTGVSALRTC